MAASLSHESDFTLALMVSMLNACRFARATAPRANLIKEADQETYRRRNRFILAMNNSDRPQHQR
jgi:hypothetical protein